jgi:hypothetical protein
VKTEGPLGLLCNSACANYDRAESVI